MYNDEFGFDAMTLESPLVPEAKAGPADALEQGFSDRMAGLLFSSDLFAARNAGPRHWIDDLTLATCWQGATLRYCGERLDQDDLDAFLGCVLLAFRDSGRSGAARFHLRDLTRLIRPRGRGFAARRLERSLWRLASARIEIEEGEGHVLMQAKLLNTLLCDRAAGICAVDVSPRVMGALRTAPAVEHLLACRAPFGSGPFHRWLACLLAQGPAACRLDMAALRRLSGLTRQPMATFRVRVVTALQDFLDMGLIASIEQAGPDRLVAKRPIARGEEAACLLLS